MDAVIIALAISAVFAAGSIIEWAWHRRRLILDNLPRRRPKPLTQDEQKVLDWLRSLREEEPPPEVIERIVAQARRDAAAYVDRLEQGRP